MSEIREQRERIAAIKAVKYITSTFRDISATELTHFRERFEKNAMFRNEMGELYTIVWRIAASSGNEDLLRAQNTQPVFVAYTTNHHFYGSLNEDVIDAFIASTSADDECVIIGDTGRAAWEARGVRRKKVSYVTFMDDTPTHDETHVFLQRVQTYPYVYVYYPQFVSVFRQQAGVTDITFRPGAEEEQKEAQSRELFAEYILEPELKDMLLFFNKQIRYVLFEQILLETQLSRVAARLVKMDAADHNAEGLLQQEGRYLRHAEGSVAGRRMLETLVGYIQWHTKKSPHIAQ
jgi:ATP synthase F1 gamma subunit